MKNKSWIIIVIMGIALTISMVYSVIVSKKVRNKESTVTTTSIIEMTATTMTIKNTLIGEGTIEYKEKAKQEVENAVNEIQQNSIQEELNNVNTENNLEENSLTEKQYQIELSIEDKDLEKVKVGQEVEIFVKHEENVLNYVGKVNKINKNSIKSTINVEITNADELIKENMTANCTIVMEKAENVVALPTDAIQKNEQNEQFVDVVQPDGSTKQVIIKTGISDNYYVEITQGLDVGDRVQIVKSSTTVVNNNEASEK